MRERRTIGRQVQLSGIGLHTGQEAKVVLKPSKCSCGVVFRRTDLGRGGGIPACLENVVSTERCVTLGRAGAKVATVEHLVAALFGFGITDVWVEVHGPELPIGGGDALHWVELLKDAGTSPLKGEQKVLKLKRAIEVREGKAFIRADPSDEFEVRYKVRYDHPLVKEQTAIFREGMDFASEIAPARTFGFIEEVQVLRAKGLAKGGSLENAIVISPDHFSVPLRFENELARHKILDLLGDLSMTGGFVCAKITAVGAGHTLHVELARRIVEEARTDV